MAQKPDDLPRHSESVESDPEHSDTEAHFLLSDSLAFVSPSKHEQSWFSKRRRTEQKCGEKEKRKKKKKKKKKKKT